MNKKNFKSFVFPETIKKQIDTMPTAEMQLKFYQAVSNYGMYDEEPKGFSDIETIIWISMQDLLDNSKANRGGAPLGNDNASKTTKTTQNNLKTTKTTFTNDNVNVNVNVNVKEREENLNKDLQNYSDDEQEETLSNDFFTQNNNYIQDFKPPTQQQVIDYCKTNKLQVDAYSFFDFYTSNDWLVGKNKMKDWRASLRIWERREHNKKLSTGYTQSSSLLMDKSPKDELLEQRAFEIYTDNPTFSFNKCLELAKNNLLEQNAPPQF